jgi:tetratricopeptide (TPR) repeat protein
MRPAPIAFAVVLSLVLITGSADASWYDDYDAGLAAVRAGNWRLAEQKMSAAIRAKDKEGNKERAYGTIFYNYHPYYYRGVANAQLGNYEQAVRDLETATGIGPENLGTIEMQLQMAKGKLQAATVTPTPVPQPTQPVTPTPQPPSQQPVNPVPATPRMDPALRSRAQAAVNEAREKVQSARDRRATGTTMTNALTAFTDANSRLASAKSNDELNSVIAIAENAGVLADAATAPAVTTPTRPIAATAIVLDESSRRVRQALEKYFNGDFDDAAREFQRLTSELPNNGWIWAFLGASQYSQYAFEADEQYRDAAIDAFKRAKRLGSFKKGLPSKYFSRRIRRAYDQTAG